MVGTIIPFDVSVIALRCTRGADARSSSWVAPSFNDSTPLQSVLATHAVRREEDYGAAMMAIENLLIAAAADGIGTWLRTGAR